MASRSELRTCGLAGALGAIALCACATVRPAALPEVVVPVMPGSDEEEVIAEAIRRAVVEQKDIPGYADLVDKDTVMVKCEFGLRATRRSFTAGALPHSEKVHFRLLTRKDIDRLRKIYGRVDYLMVLDLQISGDTATIDIQLAHSSWYHCPEWVTWLGGEPGWFWSNGYILHFRKEGDAWQAVNQNGIMIHNIN